MEENKRMGVDKSNIDISINERYAFFASDPQDEEVIREIVKMLCERELTIDRASRILADAQKLLPFVAKLVFV